MRGVIRVLGDGAQTAASATETTAGCPHHAAQPAPHSFAERGAYLFQTMGCTKCHGDGGRGGIQNANYVKDTVPALNVLADRMLLFEKGDADLAVGMLEKHVDPTTQAASPPFPRYEGFLAQYNAVRTLIRDGNPAAKKNADGPAPPMSMPAWGDQLSSEDIDAVIAYLIRQFPWDEE
jgi:mono/diheme cytochrome c family protein